MSRGAASDSARRMPAWSFSARSRLGMMGKVVRMLTAAASEPAVSTAHPAEAVPSMERAKPRTKRDAKASLWLAQDTQRAGMFVQPASSRRWQSRGSFTADGRSRWSLGFVYNRL